jgi:hypothetical protein
MSLHPVDFKHVTGERVFTPVDANAGRRSPSRLAGCRVRLSIRKVASANDDAKAERARAVAAAVFSPPHTPMAFAPLLRQVSKPGNIHATITNLSQARSAARRSHGWPRPHAQALSLR